MADALTEAQDLYRESIDAQRDQRQQITEDLAFSDPANPQQWDVDEKRRREGDPGGARPCLVFDQCGQYVSNVAGQVEQQPPAMHALPVTGGDRRVAEQLDGHFRHIEHTSRAQQHYARALTSAARCGVGYLTVRPTFVDRALKWQEPRIGSEGDPLRVVLDPWSVELDGSDATFGGIITPISLREWNKQYKGKDPVSFGEEDQRRVRDERESVRIAEWWTTRDETVNKIIFLDIKGDEVCLSEDDYWQAYQRGQVHAVKGNYAETMRRVYWRKMSGADILETCEVDGKEAPFPADSIGLVPVYGYVGWSDGRMTYCGISRRAMSAQRAYNFHMSEARAYMATAPKSPWIVPIRAIAGVEKLWDRASVEQRAYLPYNDQDEIGPIQQPQRAASAVNLTNHLQGAEQALKDIQASIGMYQASLGAPSNETSGIAIEQRKQQGEASTAHFQSHLAASIGQLGSLCLQMTQRLMDTKRQMRTLSLDGVSSSVTVNPDQAEALTESDQGLTINPNVGRYDVRVVVGAAYSTQRQQAQEAFTEMMRANPQLGPAIAPLWAQVLDVPHADKLAQVLAAMAPPAVQSILNPEAQNQPTTEALQQRVEQLQQALQEAIQHAQEAQQEAQEASAALQEKQADAEAKEAETHIRAYDAVTKRLQVMGTTLTPEHVAALVMQTVQQALTVQPSEEAEPEQPEQYEMQPFPAVMDSPNAEMAPEIEHDDIGAGV